MKPVTELYEAAEHEAGGKDNRLMSALGGIDVRARAQGQTVPALLGLLDLVATLPQERLGLVRWVVGLSELDLALLRAALLRDSERLDTWEYREHAKRMAAGYQAALSGGEGGAKCPECQGQGYHLAEHVSETERVLDQERCATCDGTGEGGSKEKPKPTILPAGKPATHTSTCVDGCACRADDATGRPDCQTCPWGMPMYDAQWRVLPGQVWCRHQHEYERMLGSAAKSQQPEKRILPAGKPPPFLRVGMVLLNPQMHAKVNQWKVVAIGRGEAKVHDMASGAGWVPLEELLTWPLAEPFTVEGES